VLSCQKYWYAFMIGEPCSGPFDVERAVAADPYRGAEREVVGLVLAAWLVAMRQASGATMSGSADSGGFATVRASASASGGPAA
jgi:hypothetical protein